ncbi:DUF2000 family protein [Nesterenkonia flava]|uniref:DUF2000 family protein n=1 Tax=Nesterenkonia flava TaxID=469799 RepID=A0ABU1FSZ5_9MICC|nr:DUF2000 family protein [Nesterenkonia flava]
MSEVSISAPSISLEFTKDRRIKCVTATSVSGVLGPAAEDAGGSQHAPLPWLGCTVVTASREKLRVLRAKAQAREDTYVADMPVSAQQTRVYQEYLETMAGSPAEELVYAALSVVGPRSYIERLIGGLSLME